MNVNNTATNVAYELTDDGGTGLGYYFRKWYFFVLLTAALLGAAYYYNTYVVVPEYLVSGTVLIKENNENSGSVANDILAELDVLRQSSKIEDEIEILKSDRLMQRALLNLDQQVGYYVGEREVAANSLPFHVVIDSLSAKPRYDTTYALAVSPSGRYRLNDVRYTAGQSIQLPGGTRVRLLLDSTRQFSDSTYATFALRDIDVLTTDYLERLNVSQVNLKSSVVNIDLIDLLPERGVAIMNNLIEGYQTMLVDEKAQLADNTLRLIDDRLNKLTNELNRVEYSVAAIKRENELTDVESNAQGLTAQAAEYNRQVADYDLRLEMLYSMRNYLTNGDDEFKAVPTSLSIQDQTLNALMAEYNTARLERLRTLGSSTPGNFLVQEQTRDLRELRRSILENVNSLASGMESVRSNLRRKAGQYEERVARIPALERELAEIKRDQSIKNNLYLYLLRKREEAALSLATGAAQLRIISPPKAAKEPVNSRKTLTYFGAFAMGMLIPFLLLNLRRRVNKTVETPLEVSTYTGAPLLGEISHNGLSKRMLVTRAGENSSISELFRLLVFNLEFASKQQGGIIMVTSSKSGEGKTFISTNLAAALAQAGKRVVVARLDLRNNRTDPRLEFYHERGVTEYLQGEETMAASDILYPSEEVPNLYYLPAGALAKDPARMMRSPELKELLTNLRQEFDYVIVDSAPVGLVSDPLALSDIIDRTLYVVRSKVTKVDELRILNDIYKKGKLPNPMIVMNDSSYSAARYGYQ